MEAEDTRIIPKKIWKHRHMPIREGKDKRCAICQMIYYNHKWHKKDYR